MKQQNKQQNADAKVKIIPLGGLEQIGMNITAIECNDSIIVVDCGLAFPSDDMLGIDPVSYTHLEIKKEVASYVDQVYEDKNFTFKVDAKRVAKKYPVSSEQMNRDLGEVILDTFPETKVDVHHPDGRLKVCLLYTSRCV